MIEARHRLASLSNRSRRPDSSRAPVATRRSSPAATPIHATHRTVEQLADDVLNDLAALEHALDAHPRQLRNDIATPVAASRCPRRIERAAASRPSTSPRTARRRDVSIATPHRRLVHGRR
jgi:hypothetical protein